MSKKKILFIIQSYPSERSANVLCDEKIMLELIKNNIYDIHVLCYRYNFQCKEEKINGINVHRFSRGLLWNLYTWARYQKNNFKTKMVFLIDRILLRIKEFITIPIFPIYQPFAILLYYYHACHLMKKEKFDFVIAEHNGLDTLMTGYLLKKKYPKIKFMPIFWDALSGGFKVKYLPTKFSQNRKERLELKVFNLADKIIAMESHQEHLKKVIKNQKILDKIKFLNIPYLVNYSNNVFKNQLNILLPDTKKYIVFAGNLWQRNPEYFINVLSKCKFNNITLLLISPSKKADYIKQLANEYEVDVKYLYYLPHDKLINILMQASFLLNFGVSNPNAISGKIFEYMGFGKPIISTYAIDNEACIPYLKKYPLSFLLDEREKDISKQAIALQKFIEENIDKKVSYEEIAPLFYKNTPQAYVEEINKLLKEE